MKQREALAANAGILKRLAEIDRSLLEHDKALKILWHRLQPLLAPAPEKPKRKIGFHPGNRRPAPDAKWTPQNRSGAAHAAAPP